ncbi:uncharacterized protein ACA1_040820 [Acanthamoeba castellanii str. Neff]|uniref:Ubiquitin-like domain-containing protein n=1 Tax=Acanthamoeba castellanii (strain ATCC 30010 / Neff) TaxID=1257118 RepID=L8H2X7_ACACF|nr:uncharacterized protein ACA1_040820 [Acanthamoeba castellanii str. Neff]ELR18766.1 hypothetical protein ACA1_040820 [Acanthamoeba castellanii str. Neff]
MQLLVSSIDGRLLSFSFPTTHVTLASVKQAFEDREGVPVSELRVSCNGRYLPDEFGFTEEQALGLPPLRVGLRVVGGKGGFGSLLRGGNTKVGQKKTTNFDACRDLNGRRLRHVNNEKRLAEWYAQEKERELARIGERHSRVAQKQAVTPFDEVAYNQTLESIEEEVASSLQVGLQEARAAREHRQANPPPPPSAPSWDFAYSDSEDEEEEGDSEEEEKEEKGKEKEEAEAKSGVKRERPEEEEEAENKDGEARHTPKKAKKDDSESTTTTACGKASALPPPPAWILG